MIRPICFTFASLLFLFVGTTRAELRLANIFGDHMVLQQEKPLTVWGWAEPGAEVTVTLTESVQHATDAVGEEALRRQQPATETDDEKEPKPIVRIEYVHENAPDFATVTRETKAGPEGRWSVELDALQASFRPKFLCVTSGDERMALVDLLVGEVWVTAGQSNMAFSGDKTGWIDKEGLLPPGVRYAHTGRNASYRPLDDLPQRVDWLPCTDGHAAGLSTIPYLFGKFLHGQLQVPVGIINAASGGAEGNFWCSLEAMHAIDFWSVKQMMAAHDAAVAAWEDPASRKKILDEYEQQYAAEHTGFIVAHDVGRGLHPSWKRPLAERAVHWALRDVYKTIPDKSYSLDRVEYENGRAMVYLVQRGERRKRTKDGWDVEVVQNPVKLATWSGNDSQYLGGFLIAGADRRWYPAKVEPNAEKKPLEVWSDLVDEPIALRYGWAGYPVANIGPWENPPAAVPHRRLAGDRRLQRRSRAEAEVPRGLVRNPRRSIRRHARSDHPPGCVRGGQERDAALRRRDGNPRAEARPHPRHPRRNRSGPLPRRAFQAVGLYQLDDPPLQRVAAEPGRAGARPDGRTDQEPAAPRGDGGTPPGGERISRSRRATRTVMVAW